MVLLLAGGVAWVAALGLCVNDKSAAVATAFVTAGLALIAGAGFYGRIRELGPSGIKTDPVAVVEKVKAELPPPAEELSPESERAATFRAIEVALETAPGTAVQVPAPEASQPKPAEVGVQTYERAIDLELRARSWLEGQDMMVEDGHNAGVDLIARQDSDITAIEFAVILPESASPTPENLRAAFAQARTWADLNIGTDGAFYRVLVTDAAPPDNYIDRFKEHGIGITILRPGEPMESVAVLSPKDSRE